MVHGIIFEGVTVAQLQGIISSISPKVMSISTVQLLGHTISIVDYTDTARGSGEIDEKYNIEKDEFYRSFYRKGELYCLVLIRPSNQINSRLTKELIDIIAKSVKTNLPTSRFFYNGISE